MVAEHFISFIVEVTSGSLNSVFDSSADNKIPQILKKFKIYLTITD
jgi:hypothetical protein